MNHVRLKIGSAAFRHWFALLQTGVRVLLRSGASIHEFLCAELGLDPAYVEARVQTVLLDGRPVDDLHTARPRPGAVLALSGPMPGLAGATLRRAGFFAPMRYQISHAPGTTGEAGGESFLTLKLFNVLIRELGPRLFEKGILINGRELKGVLGQGEGVFSGCRGAWLNDRRIEPLEMAEAFRGDEYLELRIEVAD